TQRKVAARIVRAFVGDALRHRLGALKMLAGIEVGALPAGMEGYPALGALAGRIGQRREWRPAVRAAGDGPSLGHRRRARLGRLLGRSLPLLLVFPVAPLAVSPVFHVSPRLWRSGRAPGRWHGPARGGRARRVPPAPWRGNARRTLPPESRAHAPSTARGGAPSACCPPPPV